MFSFFEMLSKDFSRFRQIKREQIEKIIVFANIIIKIYYNELYKFINFFKKSLIYFRLYYEYKISKFNNYKLYNQRVGSFKILKKIGKLVYRLKFLLIMIIYSIVSIVQLEFKYFILNSYKRRDNVNLFFVIKIDGSNEKTNTKVYEIEIFFEKKIFRDTLYYLIK